MTRDDDAVIAAYCEERGTSPREEARRLFGLFCDQLEPEERKKVTVTGDDLLRTQVLYGINPLTRSVVDGWLTKRVTKPVYVRALIGNDLKDQFGIEKLEYKKVESWIAVKIVEGCTEVRNVDFLYKDRHLFFGDKEFFVKMIAYDIMLGYLDRHSRNLLVKDNGRFLLIDDSVNFNYFSGWFLGAVKEAVGFMDSDFDRVRDLLQAVDLKAVSKICRTHLETMTSVEKFMKFFRTRVSDADRLVKNYRLSIVDPEHWMFLKGKKFYQSIVLPDGIIEGNYDTENDFREYEKNMPDVTGMTVLDIGCNLGVNAIMMLRRGAASAVGLERQKYHLDKAKKLIDRYGFQLRIDHGDAHDYLKNEMSYDVVMLLSVFHHLVAQKFVLTRLKEIAKRFVFLEVLLKEEGRNTSEKQYVSDEISDGVKKFSAYPTEAAFEKFFSDWKLVAKAQSGKSENRILYIWERPAGWVQSIAHEGQDG